MFTHSCIYFLTTFQYHIYTADALLSAGILTEQFVKASFTRIQALQCCTRALLYSTVSPECNKSDLLTKFCARDIEMKRDKKLAAVDPV